jgi:RNA polymerase sigma-70 factor (ECF subfamily)
VVNALEREPDDVLVEIARAEGSGDTRAFEVLVGRHQGFVGANCRAITRSPADAEDLAQEVFVKAYFGLRRFEGRAQFRGWLQRIKVNHCLNFLRKTRGVVMLDVEEPELAGHASLQTAPTAGLALERERSRDAILRALDAMTDTVRIPLMLRDADGLAYEEIAEQLGIGLSAVKMRIKRGREEFRRRYAAAMDTRAPGAEEDR